MLTAALVGGVLIPSLAMAQDSDDSAPDHTHPDWSSPASRWDVTVGGGVGVRPTYEGSDRYAVTPVPYIDVTYDDWLSLGPGGLSAYWHDGNLRIGGGLTRNGGRKDSDGNGIFNEGDARLKGLGNIGSAVGFKAFASYKLGLVKVSGTVTKFNGSTSSNGSPTNDGVLVGIDAAMPFHLTDKLMIMTKVGATWANQNYMQTFFGVTAMQAANSRFSPYTANAGLKNVDVGIGASYRFNPRWSIHVLLDVKELTGDAAKSPITFSKTDASFMTTINYHF